jgi:hypothetical protein
MMADFFVHDVEYYRCRDDGRLAAADFPPWSLDEALTFLKDRCGLSRKLPGSVVEHHGSVFGLWRTAIASGRLDTPFQVTHVDAHADIGLGDAGYVYLMTDLLFEPHENRQHPKEGVGGLDDGNWLAFALACRWITDLVYVFNDGGGNDILHYHMQDFDVSAPNIELKAVRGHELARVMFQEMRPEVARFEPRIPFHQLHWESFRAQQPFDAVFLARSPSFTPPECDVIFDEIRHRFIDEDALL